MQRGERKVSGFGEGDGVVHGLAVANLAHHDDVRGLAQGVFQGDFPVFGVDADLPLRHDAVFVRVHEFDRIFDGDDVAEGILVAVIDERGERGALAGAGAADEDHQAAFEHGDLLENGRQHQLLEGGDPVGDGAQHQRHGAFFQIGIDAEAPDPGGIDGEVAFLGRLELGGLPVVHQGAGDLRGMDGGERLRRLRGDLAVDFQRRREVRRDEEVGGLFLLRELEQVVDEAQ